MDIRISRESGKPVAANVAEREAAPAAQQPEAVAVANAEATARAVAPQVEMVPRRALRVEQMPADLVAEHRAAEQEAGEELQLHQQHRHFHREYPRQA